MHVAPSQLLDFEIVGMMIWLLYRSPVEFNALSWLNCVCHDQLVTSCTTRSHPVQFGTNVPYHHVAPHVHAMCFQ